MRKGYFICLEGGEGAGKTTQRQAIAMYFESQGFEVVQTREPGGTPNAERVRELLLAPTDEPFPIKAEILLFFAAREMHVENVIKPALARGAIVLCDRFVDSTYAYQAARGEITPAEIAVIDQWTLKGFRPHMTFLFDISLENSLARMGLRGKKDRIEEEFGSFFDKTHLAYLSQFAKDPHRYRLIDGNENADQVYAQILPHLLQISNQLLTGSRPTVTSPE